MTTIRQKGVVLLMLVAGLARPASSQIPDKFENLQALPKDIQRDSLVQIMRGFSFALGVRCQYCHTGGDGVSFAGVSFKSDEKTAKQNARFMIRMVDSLNKTVLAALPARHSPPVTVQCVTCHRGLSRPTTLEAVLAATIDRAGVDSAVTQYRTLRARASLTGQYDFTEWRINELARHLATDGKTAEAIAILEMNGEFNPQSASIDVMLGELHRQRGERDKAIERYRKAIQKEPGNQQARQRLTEFGVPIP
jgi:tetratricopeptide (TPR) repeat protein